MVQINLGVRGWGRGSFASRLINTVLLQVIAQSHTLQVIKRRAGAMAQ